MSSAEQARINQIANDEGEESLLLFGSAILTFTVLVIIMVGQLSYFEFMANLLKVFVGWLAGARFDDAWRQLHNFSIKMASPKSNSNHTREEL